MIKLLKKFNWLDFFPQVIDMIKVMKETVPFVQKNKLWLGIFEYKWISFLIVSVSVFFSWYVLSDLGNYFFSESNSEMMQLGMVDGLDEISDTIKEGAKNAKGSIFSGGTKYLLLILMEVIIFYFSVKTLSIITQKKSTPTFKHFVSAEKRMIHLMIRNFIKGILALVVISIILSIIGFKSLSDSVMFFVYAYFIGYAFLDNYNEQFGMKIKESQVVIRQNVGAALTLGIIVTVLLYIPLIGPLFTPILGGVAASIYGNRFAIQGEEERILYVGNPGE